MNKVTLGPQTLVYPMPAFLVGADIDGKANFMTVAWGGIANGEPPMISVAIRHSRHTLKGIRENGTFSVNIPSTDMAKEADYCGIASGARADKTEVCRFKVFYGRLGNAPMIEQCPINLECKLVETLDLGSHALAIGRIEETHISQNCLSGGKPDIDKINPLTYAPSPTTQYLALGKVIGKAFSMGRKLKQG